MWEGMWVELGKVWVEFVAVGEVETEEVRSQWVELHGYHSHWYLKKLEWRFSHF